MLVRPAMKRLFRLKPKKGLIKMKTRQLWDWGFHRPHLCKLRGILRSRVLRDLYVTLSRMLSRYSGEQSLTDVVSSECINIYVAMPPFLFSLDVIWLAGIQPWVGLWAGLLPGWWNKLHIDCQVWNYVIIISRKVWVDSIVFFRRQITAINDAFLRESGKLLLVIGQNMSGDTCVAPPTNKNVISPIFCTNLRLEAPLPVLFLYIRSLCHNFSYTFDPKMHHTAMDSYVL